jgi:hypothetical protein
MIHVWMVIFTLMTVSKTGTTYGYYPADIAGAAFYDSKAQCEIVRPSFDKTERINAAESTNRRYARRRPHRRIEGAQIRVNLIGRCVALKPAGLIVTTQAVPPC